MPEIQGAVAYAYDNSTYYRERLDELGIDPREVTTVEDLDRIPVLLDKVRERESMERSLERDGHPYGEHLCAPLEDVVGVCSTSGTTGDPTFYPFTAQDIAIQDSLWAAGFAMHGVQRGETVLHAFGLSMFLAGVPVVRALERMGARPVPVGAEAGSEKLVKVARLTRPTSMCCTPSYAEYLMEKFDTETWGVQRIFCAGEPGAGLPELRTKLEEGYGGARIVDMMGGGKGTMSVSCTANAGLHQLGSEHSIQQIIDPETGAPIPWKDGAVGLRLMTTLSQQAAPFLRATPGDICEVFDSPCACGLTSQRYRVIGRTDDMLIIKGSMLYPAAVRNLVAEFAPRLTGHFRIILDEPGPKVQPPLKLRVELGDGQDPAVGAELVKIMHNRFGVTPALELVPAVPLERDSHKQKLIEVAG
jgi:phenylacetate-CoA ligase